MGLCLVTLPHLDVASGSILLSPITLEARAEARNSISCLRGRFEIGCQAASSSNSALACFKETVSKPSVNQP
jgi:hypothetical protein